MARTSILKAKYIMSGDGKVLTNHEIVVEGSRIAGIEPAGKSPAKEVHDFGDAVLMPGFINAHTHLELTDLGRPVTRRQDLTLWLDEVRELRDGKDDRDLVKSSRKGVETSIEYGTTTIVDHANSANSYIPLRDSGLRVFLLFEMVAFPEQLYQEKAKLLDERIAGCEESEFLRWGIAPHSAYGVSERLLKKCEEVVHDNGRMISIHASEHEGEVELFETGAGPFIDFLTRLGSDFSKWKSPKMTPVAYLEKLGLVTNRTLMIHCNYLRDGDFEIIKNTGASAVYCPRSHFYFYHRYHPFKKLLSEDIRVIFGTDSMVSNWSLDLLEELKFVYHSYEGVTPAQLIRMATADAAEALGIADKVGKLAPGMEADIIAIRIPPNIDDPLEGVLDQRSRNIFTMTAGNVLYEE
jgi:cytosine/adenosine deaminase-related metal-dependent hydrolase